MDWRAACAAVIPCLNEQAAIGPLVAAIKPLLSTILVVDDGSSDQTAQTAQAQGASVLRHSRPLGKGAALQTGWSAAHKLGCAWAVSLDGDGQHAPDDIPSFWSRAEQSGAALVVGNRLCRATDIPFVRRWVNRAMSWELSRLTGQTLADSQCGFRLMRLSEWAALPIQAPHFEIESEVLLQFARAGLEIEFVPIRVIYKKEQSKIHPLWDTIRWLNWRHRASWSTRAGLSVQRVAEE